MMIVSVMIPLLSVNLTYFNYVTARQNTKRREKLGAITEGDDQQQQKLKQERENKQLESVGPLRKDVKQTLHLKKNGKRQILRLKEIPSK